MREIIDMFCHIMPENYYRKVEELTGSAAHMLARAHNLLTMSNLDARFKLMDKFEGYKQIPTLVSPAVESFADKDVSPILSRIANEEMAELVNKCPDYFPAFVATLPMNNVEASIVEAEYSIKYLGAKGVQLFTEINGRALDNEEYFPVYEAAYKAGGSLWLHPHRGMFKADYEGEEASKYELWWALGWPYDSSMAMARLMFSGIFEKFPGINIVTHHCGGVIPMLQGRFASGMDSYGTRTPKAYAHLSETPITVPPFDSLKNYYADTASFGSKATVDCGIDFFGIEKIVFASDMPFGPGAGLHHITETIKVVESLDIPEKSKDLIFSGNAKKMLGL